MCGIVGYIGSRPAVEVLIKGLSSLEYRGYDSAGVAVLDEEGRLNIQKSKGRLVNLEKRLEEHPLSGTVGIGHTRWATHGEPSDLNAHPHTDAKGRIAIVHNGIIENYMKLREWLEGEGCVFVSETDTEVAAHLINFLYKGDMKAALADAREKMEGSYALAIISRDEPNTLYCIRKESPLILGVGKGEQFIASDIPAVLPYTRDVIFLNDNEIAEITREGAAIYDQFLQAVTHEPYHVTWDAAASEKGGYEHFMLKEINEQPDALAKTFSPRVDMKKGEILPECIPVDAKEAKELSKMVVVACGTAYHAGVIGRYLIEKMARLPVEADIASEYRYRDPILSKDDLFLVVSQSGETADTLAAMREAKRKGAKVCALTNVVGSSISREAGDRVMYTWAGPEIAVASTKAYTTQVEVLTLMAMQLGLMRGTLPKQDYDSLLAEMEKMPEMAKKILEEKDDIQRFVSRNFSHEHVFFIGRGLDYALSMEASLKLKEVSYVMSEAYAAGELKHGTIALIEQGTLVVAICTQPDIVDKTLSNLREVKTRGAQTLVVCTEGLKEKCAKEADALWTIPDIAPALAPALAIIPLQLFAYYMAIYRGCDVDKPRNLAKSVTVE